MSNNILYMKPVGSLELVSYLGGSSIPYPKVLTDPKDIICW